MSGGRDGFLEQWASLGRAAPRAHEPSGLGLGAPGRHGDGARPGPAPERGVARAPGELDGAGPAPAAAEDPAGGLPAAPIRRPFPAVHPKWLVYLRAEERAAFVDGAEMVPVTEEERSRILRAIEAVDRMDRWKGREPGEEE